jgi:hypothetical protein
MRMLWRMEDVASLAAVPDREVVTSGTWSILDLGCKQNLPGRNESWVEK